MNCTRCGAEMAEGMAFCPSCGAPRAEAAAAAPPGAGSGRPTAPPPGAAPPTERGIPTEPPAPPPGSTPSPTPSESRRPPLGVLVGVGVVAVLVLAAIGYALFSGLGSDGSGGADSPEEAVRQLAASVETGDPVGVLENLEPDEVGPVLDLLEVTTQRAEELDLLVDDSMAGFEISVDGLELSTDELAPGVVKVTVDGGSVEGTVSQPDFGFVLAGQEQPVLDAGATTDFAADLNDLYGENDDGDQLDAFLVAVERDGSWFVSPLYTLAELAREDGDLEPPDFEDPGFEPVGADSPTEAVEAFAEASFDVDPEATLSMVAPGEFAFARDYFATFEDALDDDLDSVQDSDPELAELDLGDAVEGDDGVMLVPVDELRFTYDDDGDPVEISIESGPCITREDEYDTDETCFRQSLLEDGTDPALADLVPEDLFVATVEHDGSWYVSPIVTLAEYGKYAVEHFDERHLGSLGVVRPKSLEVGETIEATVETPYQPDVYQFEPPDADAFVVELSADAAELESAVYPPGVEDPPGLASDYTSISDGETGGALVVDAADPEYAVEVWQYVGGYYEDDFVTLDAEGNIPDPDARGLDPEPLEYTLRVVPLDIEDAVSVGDEVSGSLDEGEWALYEVEGTDEEVTLEIDGSVEATLLDDDGYTVTNGDYAGYGNGRSMFLAVRATDDGDYRVSLEEPRFGFDLPSGTNDPTPLTPGSVQDGAVVDDVPVDYVLSGVDGPVTITVRRTSSDPAFVPLVTLFAADGDVLDEVEAGADGSVIITAPSTADDLVVVSVWGAEATDGTFTIEAALG